MTGDEPERILQECPPSMAHLAVPRAWLAETRRGKRASGSRKILCVIALLREN
jgi:hypothetical protein